MPINAVDGEKALSRILLLLAGLLLLGAAPATAQLTPSSSESETTDVVVPDDLTPAEVRDMVSRLSDGQVRDLLLKRLDAVAAQNAEPDGPRQDLPEFVIGLAEGIGDSVITAVERLPNLVVT